MNLFLIKGMKTKWELLKDVILKVGYQYFSAQVGGCWMLSFPCNAWFDEECKADLKMLEVEKDKNDKKIESILKSDGEEEENTIKCKKRRK